MSQAEHHQQELEQQEMLEWAKRWKAGDKEAQEHYEQLSDELKQVLEQLR